MGLRGTALFETGDVPCEVIGSSSIGIELRLDGIGRPQESLRLAFEHTGSHPGTIRALCSVDGKRESEKGEILYLRLIALHSVSGVLCLTAFLQDGLDLDRVNTESFKEGAGGWFYSFKARWKTDADEGSSESPTPSADEQKRREVRVAVRDQVNVITVDGQEHTARAYNISRNGVYVLTQGFLPHVAAEVTIAYELPFEGGSIMAKLNGEVMWSMANMDSNTSGGIGVVLQSVEDGAGGDTWRAYVDSEADFGESISLSS